MKKSILGLAALALLASCNNDEELNSLAPEAITFGNPFVDNATRAIDPSYSGTKELTSIKVYGNVSAGNGTVAIFNGDEATGNVGDDAWALKDQTKKQYWIKGATYNFAAVADASKVIAVNGMPTVIEYNGTGDVLYTKDVVTRTGQAEGNGTVDFTFRHLLSKAYFTVTSNTEGGYYYSVKNIAIVNHKTGTYDIAQSKWTGTDEKSDVAFGKIENVTAANVGGKTCESEVLLIPTTDDFLVKFIVELWNNNGTPDNFTDDVLLNQDKTAKDGKSISTDLLEGNVYNFTINLSVGEEIQFTVKNDPNWANPTNGVDVK